MNTPTPPFTGQPAPAAQTGPKVEVQNLFATPVAVVTLPDAEARNRALAERILAHERATPSVHHSNLGGWQSPDDFARWGGPEGQALLQFAENLGRQLVAGRDGSRLDPEWRVNAWANVNRAGQGNEFHTHPGAYWSATYYVRDGGVGDDPALGGEFEMADPRGVAPAMLAPHFAFATRGGASAGASELIRPKAGMMIMFPSWLSHAVRPYRGQDVRISIALNLTPV